MITSDNPDANPDLHALQAGMKAVDLSSDAQSHPPTPPLSQRSFGRSAGLAKPAPQASNSSAFNVPDHLKIVQQVYDAYKQKIYLGGCVYQRYKQSAASMNPSNPVWTECHAELCGSDFIVRQATANGDAKPTYINISEATAFVNAPPEGSPYNHAFKLKAAGSVDFIWFVVSDESLSLQWVQAIRLSCFERSKIEEIYTQKLLSKSIQNTKKLAPKLEGYVQVRFGDGNNWQKCWVVMSDRRDEKKLFGKKSVPSRGQLMFYENKKSKTPMRIMVNVVQAYAVYHESPQLIENAKIMKVEGSYLDDSVAEPNASIMTESKAELLQWLLGTFATFKIYGHPEKLLDDPTNIKALNFAEPVADFEPLQLFLTLPEVSGVDVINDGLIDNKTMFSDLLARKIGRPVPSKAMGATGGMGQRTISMPMIAQNKTANSQSDIGHRRGGSTGQPFAQSRPRGKMTYVSDDSEDDNDEEEEEDEDEDDDDDVDIGEKKNEPIGHSKESLAGNGKQRQEAILSDGSQLEEPGDDSSRAPKQRPRPKMARPQASVSGSGSEYEDDVDDEDDDSCSEHHHQSSPLANQYSEHHQPVYGSEWNSHNPTYEEDEDGPVIPQLGDHFAKQNSLLDTFRPDHPSAKDQIEHSRLTGQPLIQIPNKPADPRAGLVGMISQIEHDKRERDSNKTRQIELEKGRLMEQQRERYMMSHPQQHMRPQPMLQNTNLSMLGAVPDPRMTMMSNMSMMPGMPAMPPYMPMMLPTTMPESSMQPANMMDPQMLMFQQQWFHQQMLQQQMMQQQLMQQQMMHPFMYNQLPQHQQHYPNEEEEDDEDDDVPLGGSEKPSSPGKKHK